MDVEYQLTTKRIEHNVLEAELAEEELWVSDEYQRLKKQIAELEAHLDAESEL